MKKLLLLICGLTLLTGCGGSTEEPISEDLPNKEYFTQHIERIVNDLSNEASLKNLQYEEDYNYITIEYEYKQCFSDCKKEFDIHALKIYEGMAKLKNRLQQANITDKISIEGYTTFIDSYGNEKSLIGVRYQMPIEDLKKINFENFYNIEKYNKFYHTSL